MIIHNVEQNSPEWLQARLGIPTASEFDSIITAGGKPSTQADGYANKLLAEIMTGAPVNTFVGNAATERGHLLEPDAVSFYELQNDCDAVKIGFCTNDEATMGCSPDRLIGDDGLLEIKCPLPHTHIKYLLSQNIDKEYYPQLQGQLLVTGRMWVDIISYHPEMPSVVIRVKRDTAYLAEMTKLLAEFHGKMKEKRQKLVSLGYMA